MARKPSPARAHRILDAAVALFSTRGYRATRVADVADRAGVAHGTVFLYFPTKEALFAAAAAHAFGSTAALDEPRRVPGPGNPDVIQRLWAEISSAAEVTALDMPVSGPPGPERITDLVALLYGWLARYHHGVRMVERCAREWPELAALFYKGLRRRFLERLKHEIQDAVDANAIPPLGPPVLVARTLLELCAFFAMHRHTAPDSQDLDDAACRATVLAFVRSALTPQLAGSLRE